MRFRFCYICWNIILQCTKHAARYTTQYSPYTHSSLKFVRQLLNSTLFSAPPFQYTGKSGRALCTEYRARLAKLLPSHPTEGGKKCCRRVSACIYTYVREKFSVLRVGVWGGRVDACAPLPLHSWRDSPARDFVYNARLYQFNILNLRILRNSWHVWEWKWMIIWILTISLLWLHTFMLTYINSNILLKPWKI